MAGQASKGFYVRKASGLVRQWGLLETYAMNLAGWNVGVSLVVGPLAAAEAFPGADMFYVLLFGLLLSVFQIMVYFILASAMPRSGGDYVWISQNLHPALGFVSSWVFVVALFLGLGTYSAWAINYVLSAGLLSIGLFANNSALINAAGLLSTSNYTFVIGLLFLISAGAFIFLGAKYTGRALKAGIIPAFWVAILVIWTLATHSHADFVASLNQLIPSDTYQDLLSQYAKAGGTFPPSSVWASLSAASVGFWAFLGITVSATIGGEVKNPGRNQPLAMTLCALTSILVLFPIFEMWYSVIGWDFTSAVAFLTNAGTYPYAAPATLNFLVGMLIPNMFLNVSLLFCMLWSIWTLILAMIAQISRLLFAYSFAQILPQKIASVNDRLHSPVVATGATVLAAAIMCALYVYTAAFSFIYNYSTMITICFGVACISAIVFPFRKKDLFAASPHLVNAKVGPLPIISILGILGAAGMWIVVWLGLVAGSMVANVFILVVLISGVIIYYVARGYRLRQGVNLDLAFQELPPE